MTRLSASELDGARFHEPRDRSNGTAYRSQRYDRESARSAHRWIGRALSHVPDICTSGDRRSRPDVAVAVYIRVNEQEGLASHGIADICGIRQVTGAAPVNRRPAAARAEEEALKIDRR